MARGSDPSGKQPHYSSGSDHGRGARTSAVLYGRRSGEPPGRRRRCGHHLNAELIKWSPSVETPVSKAPGECDDAGS